MWQWYTKSPTSLPRKSIRTVTLGGVPDPVKLGNLDHVQKLLLLGWYGNPVNRHQQEVNLMDVEFVDFAGTIRNRPVLDRSLGGSYRGRISGIERGRNGAVDRNKKSLQAVRIAGIWRRLAKIERTLCGWRRLREAWRRPALLLRRGRGCADDTGKARTARWRETPNFR